MKKRFSKKLLSVILASSMVAGLTGCGSSGGGSKDSKEPITLEVFSQLANYSGMQGGWSADILLEKFNVKLNIIPDPAGNSVYDTRAESGDLGDIVVFGNNYDNILVLYSKGCFITGMERVCLKTVVNILMNI